MNIAVFCGASRPASASIAKVARELGRRLARDGHTLVYGGSNLGLMGEVSGAALAEGGQVVGVIPTFFGDNVIFSQSVSEYILVSTIAERKERMLAMCDAFIALPGGIGTLDEIMEVMVANQLQHMNSPMVLLNIDGFYDPFLQQLEYMKDEGLLRSNAGLRVEEDLDFLEGLKYLVD